MYQTVALNVVSTLCMNGDLAPKFVSMIPKMISMFNKHKDQNLLADILRCLIAMANDDSAEMIQSGIVVDLPSKLEVLSPVIRVIRRSGQQIISTSDLLLIGT
eukprot:733033_1